MTKPPAKINLKVNALRGEKNFDVQPIFHGCTKISFFRIPLSFTLSAQSGIARRREIMVIALEGFFGGVWELKERVLKAGVLAFRGLEGKVVRGSLRGVLGVNLEESEMLVSGGLRGFEGCDIGEG